MTKEDRQAFKATVPAFSIFDGEIFISAGAGDMMWRLVDQESPSVTGYFNIDAVSHPELLDLIRHLIGAYNWRVRQANQGAEAGLPALERLVKVEPPAE